MRSHSAVECASVSMRQIYRKLNNLIPYSMITIWKLAPAIAAGNALIIKPPELCPLYAQKLAALVLEAGFPPGVISVLCGYGHQVGQALAEHMGIRKIAFTGSLVTGRNILKASANSNLKKGKLSNPKLPRIML